MVIDRIGYPAGSKLCPFFSGAVNKVTPDGKGLMSEVMAGGCFGAGDINVPPCNFYMTGQKTCLFWGIYQLMFLMAQKLETLEKATGLVNKEPEKKPS